MTSLRIYWLDPDTPDAAFPDPRLALSQPNGLLAMGGDLTPQRLRRAYACGIFPWYNPDESILWWCPDPRTIIDTDAIHVSRRLARTINRGDYAVTLDRHFNGVLAGCAAPRAGQPGTWLGPDMRAAYARLHTLGYAHSIEIWHHGRLVGGLYGIALGRMFFGESMFSRQTDASKIALVWLARQLADWGFPLIDGQVGSGHLYRMGARDISRSEFLALIGHLQHEPAPTTPWHFTLNVPADDSHLPSSITPDYDL